MVNQLLLHMVGNWFTKGISAGALWWRPWSYGEDPAGMEVVGAEVYSWFLTSSKRPGLEGLVTRVGLQPCLQSFKGHHHDPLWKKGTWDLWVVAFHFCISEVPLNSESWSCGQVLWKTSWSHPGLERDSHCKTNVQLLWNRRTRKLFSVWLFTAQPSCSRTPPALPRTTLKWLNLPVTPVNPVK